MKTPNRVVMLFAVGITSLSVAGSGHALPQPAPAPGETHQEEALMEGRQKTDRSIVLKMVLDSNQREVFKLWSTEDGTRRFFGEDAVIDLRAGGAYEIYFLPRDNPQSDGNSSKGAKLLWMEQDKELAFEWTVPPFASELNVQPLPTWIEVRLEPLEGHPDKTVIRVAHHGFQRGDNWDRVYEFFVRAWASVLYRLDLVCSGAEPKRPYLNID